MAFQAAIPQIITSEIIATSYETLTTCLIIWERHYLAKLNKNWRTVQRLHPLPLTPVATEARMYLLWQLRAEAASRDQILSSWSKHRGKTTTCLFRLDPLTKYLVMTVLRRFPFVPPPKLLHFFIIRRVIMKASHRPSKLLWSVALTQLRNPQRKSDQAIKSRSKMWNGKSLKT